jgi:hypothetical protein
MLNRTQELIDEQRQSRAAVPIKLDNDVQSKPKGVETKKVSLFLKQVYFSSDLLMFHSNTE